MTPELAITKITDALLPDDTLRALFLSGSHGTGTADDWSDLDFVLVTPEGPTDRIAAAWRAALKGVGEVVLWRDRIVRPALINAVMADGLRVDLIVLKPEQATGQAQDALRPLFDRDALHAGMKRAAPPAPPSPGRARYMFDEFLRILGLLPLVVGRSEWLNGVTGVFHLRNLLVELMIEETAVPHRGGALHLNRLITAEQKAALAALPIPAPDKEALVAAHLAYAAEFLPRARACAERWGVEWPERFEAATWALLADTLGISRPAG
ncbi:nucleotidyltransferase domain-containing protein [Pseudooceanicola sp. LIPI14-2-Ac024]|uniref:nucleotidyltransferase domain-containing protein n=1 Tax=Pseudooceanicola sp. LIPI14-2-Ac024 TaxID=3344875 RepID=UPI0035CF0730